MGKIYPPEKVKLIIGLISNDKALFDNACEKLEKKLNNSIDFKSDILDFSYTDYYEKEMGKNLKRLFISFEKLISLDKINMVKPLTNDIENVLSKKGKRTINIDPGYIDMAKLVLFSTKDYSHRIYAGKGIFAEVTLHYKDKCFNSWPWTYPDYKSEEYSEIFSKIRDIYKDSVERHTK